LTRMNTTEMMITSVIRLAPNRFRQYFSIPSLPFNSTGDFRFSPIVLAQALRQGARRKSGARSWPHFAILLP
ncbi:MAG: hypothetical protein KHX36_13250, partial [Clostridiales bacterium]|nr:hypothetical protein [Clostridiales bacterium]